MMWYNVVICACIYIYMCVCEREGESALYSYKQIIMKRSVYYPDLSDKTYVFTGYM